MKRRSVRIGLAAGALVAVVLATLWLCGVFAPAVELPSPSQALIEARDGLDAVLIEASFEHGGVGADRFADAYAEKPHRPGAGGGGAAHVAQRVPKPGYLARRG